MVHPLVALPSSAPPLLSLGGLVEAAFRCCGVECVGMNLLSAPGQVYAPYLNPAAVKRATRLLQPRNHCTTALSASPPHNLICLTY